MKNMFLFFFLAVSLIFAEEVSIKTFINFSRMEQASNIPSEHYGYYHELKKWANFQNMYLQPDSKRGNIHDGVCRMIPSKGLEFVLEAQPNEKRKLFLYLDLTTYKAKPNSKFPSRSLSIFLGKKLKKVVVFRPGVIADNPTLVHVDPDDIQEGKIFVKLIPDHTEGGMFWGIWDAYYTYQKEKD